MKNDMKTLLDLCKAKLETQELKNASEWKAIINKSINHSVLPHVDEIIEKNYKNLIPEQCLLELKELYKQISLSNIKKTHELIKISNILDKNEIQYLTFKGPTLAALAYGDITKRQYADIDLIVDKKKFSDVRQILTDIGYNPSFDLKASYTKIYLLSWNYLNFYSINGENDIDLHWRLALPSFSFSTGFDQLFKNKIDVKLFDSRLNTLCPEAYLLFLCQHGCKHGWTKLIWILDIHNLVENSFRFDWNLVLFFAEKYRSKKMLKAGLLISNMLFETKLPSQTQYSLNNEKELVRIIQKRIDSLLNNGSNENTFFYLSPKDIFYINTMDTFRDKLLHLFSFFKPRPVDWNFYIPSSLYFLYYFYRPIRIFRKKFLSK